jgi:hypothetical protein
MSTQMTKTRTRKKTLTVDTLEAKNIHLTDEHGKVRAFLMASENTVHCYFCDENGLPRMSLSLDPGGEPHITFMDASGKTVFGVGATNEGSVSLGLINPNSPSERISVAIQKHNPAAKQEARILITGPNGELKFAAPELK